MNDTKLNVGAICIGNGGCQVGVKLFNSGFQVIDINSSLRDLSDIVIPPGVVSYVIEDGSAQARGAGGNREVIKKMYKNWDQNTKLFGASEFDNFVKEKDVIFVVASTGGGTGSGISPTIAYQLTAKYPQKAVVLVPIFPRLSESINAQQNFVQFMNEVDSINHVDGVSIPFMPFDLTNYSHLDIEAAYDKIADEVTEAVKTISGEYATMSKYGMIDERDMLTMITCKGMITAFALKPKMSDISAKGIQHFIVDHLNHSGSVVPQRDKVCRYYGLFLDVDEAIEDPVKRGEYDDIHAAIGEPYAVFTNYGVTTNPNATIAFIASGQSLPYDRLNMAVERVKEYEKSLTQREYSISEAASSFNKFADNPSLSKIMGSASEQPAETLPDIPDFLEPKI